MENKIENMLDEVMIKDVRNIIMDYAYPETEQYDKVLKQLNWHVTMTIDIMGEIYPAFGTDAFNLKFPLRTDKINFFIQIPWRWREFEKGLKNPTSLLD